MIRSPSQWPGHRPVLDLGRPLADAAPCPRMLAARRGPAGRVAAGPPGAQAAWSARRAGRPGPARRATGRSSRGTPTSPARRDDRAQPPGDLLGRPRSSSRSRSTAARSRDCCASLAARGRRAARRRSAVGPDRPIAPPATVGQDLAGHGRGCPAECLAISRRVSPARRPRLISSRSAFESRSADRRVGRGWIPPNGLTVVWTYRFDRPTLAAMSSIRSPVATRRRISARSASVDQCHPRRLPTAHLAHEILSPSRVDVASVT